MLENLIKYPSIFDLFPAYIDPQLATEKAKFFTAVFGTATPSTQQIVSKFNTEVLIEPAIIGGWQLPNPSNGSPDAFDPHATPPGMTGKNCLDDNKLPTADMSDPNICTTHPDQCIHCWLAKIGTGGLPDTNPTCDRDECDKPLGFEDSVDFPAATNLTKLNILNQMVGANVTNITWMYAANRQLAYGRLAGDTVATPDLYSTFGTLGPNDRYYLLSNDLAHDPYNEPLLPPPASIWSDVDRGTLHAGYFLNHMLDGVKTMITVARHDANIWSPDVMYAIGKVAANNLVPPLHGSVFLKSINYDSTTNDPDLYPSQILTARHGFASYDYGPNPLPDMTTTTTIGVTMPSYYDSGHTVTKRASAELYSDVSYWYGRTQYHP